MNPTKQIAFSGDLVAIPKEPSISEQLAKLTNRVDTLHQQHAQLSARYQTLKAKGEVSEEEDSTLLNDVIIFSQLEDAAIRALAEFKCQIEVQGPSVLETAQKVSSLFQTLRGNVVKETPTSIIPKPVSPSEVTFGPISEIIETSLPIAQSYLDRANDLPDRCESLEDYIQIDRDQQRLRSDMDKFTTMIRGTAAHHGVTLAGPYLRLQIDGQEIDSPFTAYLKNATDRLADSQETRHPQQLALIKQKYEARDMGAGGDCFFRSIIGSMTKNKSDADSQHLELRRQLADHMRENKNYYANSILALQTAGDEWFRVLTSNTTGGTVVERYINSLRKQSVWGGGEAETQAMSDALQRPIVIVGADHVQIIHPYKDSGQEPVVITHGSGHYRAMLPKTSGV